MVEPKRPLSEGIAIVVGVALAIAVAVGLALLLFDTVSWWVVIGVSAAFGLLGSLTGEPLGEAIIMTIIVGSITTLGLVYLPIPSIWKQVWLSAAAAICTGKLVVGTYREFAGY